MGIPARAARPLVALAIAAASLGCIAHTETDKTMKAFEGLMTFNVIIITTAFYYMFLPFISAMAMILLLNELLDLHDRRRL